MQEPTQFVTSLGEVGIGKRLHQPSCLDECGDEPGVAADAGACLAHRPELPGNLLRFVGRVHGLALIAIDQHAVAYRSAKWR
jgi:hypothetical protein